MQDIRIVMCETSYVAMYMQDIRIVQIQIYVGFKGYSIPSFNLCWRCTIMMDPTDLYPLGPVHLEVVLDWNCS